MHLLPIIIVMYIYRINFTVHATVDVIYSENRSSIGRNGSARESHDLVDSLIVPGGKEEESEGEYKISNINDSGKKIRDEGYKIISNIS